MEPSCHCFKKMFPSSVGAIDAELQLVSPIDPVTIELDALSHLEISARENCSCVMRLTPGSKIGTAYVNGVKRLSIWRITLVLAVVPMLHSKTEATIFDPKVRIQQSPMSDC